MKKIVYYSKAGHTEAYAKMLGEILQLEVIPFSRIKEIKPEDEVIFMSWVFASMIQKLKFMLKKYHVICVAAVGMSYPSEENTKLLLDHNQLTIPFFYLQGGLDYQKVKGFQGMLLKMVAETTIRENKEENKELIEIFKNGGNFVVKENLNDIIHHMNHE